MANKPLPSIIEQNRTPGNIAANAAAARAAGFPRDSVPYSKGSLPAQVRAELDKEKGEGTKGVPSPLYGYVQTHDYTTDDTNIVFIKANQPANKVIFPGFITSYNDTFSQNINKEKVFGRMDTLNTYESTTRSISFSWKVVSISAQDAVDNLGRINHLVKAMYPDYRDNKGGGYNVTTSALMGISFHGLAHGGLSNATKGSNSAAKGGKGKSGATVSAAATQGSSQFLFGYIENLSIDHNFEDGVYNNPAEADITLRAGGANPNGDTTGDEGSIDAKGSGAATKSGMAIAKVITLNVNFTPVHPETLGFDETGEWISNYQFPYYHSGDGKLANERANMPFKAGNNEGPFSEVDFEVDPEKKALYEAYQSQLRAQEANILSPQNPWERVGDKFVNAYNSTVDFFDSLVVTGDEDINTGL